MGGGLDILIVGIVGGYLVDIEGNVIFNKYREAIFDDLTSIASKEKLEELFNNFSDTQSGGEKWEKWDEYFFRLEKNPTTDEPGLVYFSGEECGFGAAFGTGLGYVLFSGNINSDPIKLDERIFARIPELIERFKKELDSHGLDYSKYKVGLHAINVCDI